ncbi:Ribosome hibernation protein YhbH [Thioalkalivibrio nitratireducens DSM 14787]|uniref:Ribosome hibernation promoting factor n=1 Tax=Thioalkalivibrio nitratireducens (strain DSM 14787 / UNIQEM 213 / ALEN2) TaxID=1255043 RepID=L0DXG7_THIND|nr:ribosome-associated translation inhibitor RaiA [Thioalkalivibrio nitratireducens]AGA34284.1 Ribosome hibernation protein YhbH [Thioalkalivibrio nitratireducens DSM 14787]
MQINLTGHHVDITSALRDYVEDKFQRLERHFDQVIDIHVVLTVEKNHNKAEANLQVSGNQIHADTTHDDMYAAIDGLIDKTDRQLIKHKEKMKDHHRAEGAMRNRQQTA